MTVYDQALVSVDLAVAFADRPNFRIVSFPDGDWVEIPPGRQLAYNLSDTDLDAMPDGARLILACEVRLESLVQAPNRSTAMHFRLRRYINFTGQSEPGNIGASVLAYGSTSPAWFIQLDKQYNVAAPDDPGDDDALFRHRFHRLEINNNSLDGLVYVRGFRLFAVPNRTEDIRDTLDALRWWHSEDERRYPVPGPPTAPVSIDSAALAWRPMKRGCIGYGLSGQMHAGKTLGNWLDDAVFADSAPLLVRGAAGMVHGTPGNVVSPLYEAYTVSTQSQYAVGSYSPFWWERMYRYDDDSGRVISDNHAEFRHSLQWMADHDIDFLWQVPLHIDRAQFRDTISLIRAYGVNLIGIELGNELYSGGQGKAFKSLWGSITPGLAPDEYLHYVERFLPRAELYAPGVPIGVVARLSGLNHAGAGWTADLVERLALRGLDSRVHAIAPHYYMNLGSSATLAALQWGMRHQNWFWRGDPQDYQQRGIEPLTSYIDKLSEIAPGYRLWLTEGGLSQTANGGRTDEFMCAFSVRHHLLGLLDDRVEVMCNLTRISPTDEQFMWTTQRDAYDQTLVGLSHFFNRHLRAAVVDADEFADATPPELASTATLMLFRGGKQPPRLVACNLGPDPIPITHGYADAWLYDGSRTDNDTIYRWPQGAAIDPAIRGVPGGTCAVPPYGAAFIFGVGL